MGDSEKTARAAFSAIQNSQQSGDKVARLGTDAVREVIASSAEEVQKAHEKVYSYSRESADHMARSADAATRSINDAINASQEGIEAYVESGNRVVDASRNMSEEAFSYLNELFSQNVELSKELFNCRTMSDMFDLQSKVLQANIEGLFGKTAKLSEMAFQVAGEASEPINQQIADAANRFNQSLAA